jgi:hypothetical protein
MGHKMPVSRKARVERWQAMGEIQILLPAEYEDAGSLTQRAYAGYARPGDPLWDVLAQLPGSLFGSGHRRILRGLPAFLA